MPQKIIIIFVNSIIHGAPLFENVNFVQSYWLASLSHRVLKTTAEYARSSPRIEEVVFQFVGPHPQKKDDTIFFQRKSITRTLLYISTKGQGNRCTKR